MSTTANGTTDATAGAERAGRIAVLTEATSSDEVRAFARAQGWTLVEDQPRGFNLWRTFIWSDGRGSTIQLVENHHTATRLLFVRAEREHADALHFLLSAAIPLCTLTEVAEQLAQAEDPTDIVTALGTIDTCGRYLSGLQGLVGLGPELEDRLLAQVVRLARHPNRIVRMALIQTAGAVRGMWDLTGPLLARRDDETELVELLGFLAEAPGSGGAGG